LLACCTVQAAVGCAVTPATCSRRVPCSMNTSAYTRRRSTRVDVDEAAGDQALGLLSEELAPGWSAAAWAGSRPAAVRISQTVVAPMRCPRRTSSPWMPRQPHRGFSLASRCTSALPALAVGGLPAFAGACWSPICGRSGGGATQAE
jgi:hypothetical protein